MHNLRLAFLCLMVFCLAFAWAKPLAQLSIEDVDTIQKAKMCEANKKAKAAKHTSMQFQQLSASALADTSCTADSEVTEGPYFVREEYIRASMFLNN